MLKNRPTLKELARMSAEGMTQADIAESCGVTRNTVHRWIRAERDHFKNLRAIYKRAFLRRRQEQEAKDLEAELEAQHEE